MLPFIEKLQRELKERGLDAFIAIENARYLTGTTAADAVIVSEQPATLLCRRLEFGRACRESSLHDIRAYFPARVPLQKGERVNFCELWELIAERLRELGAKVVGLDSMKPDILRKLHRTYRARYLGLPKLITDMRKHKSRQELAWLRRSAMIAAKGMQRAAELIEEGRAELEIAAEAEYAMRKAGSEGVPFCTIVASGRDSWLPHATATEKKLKRGELIVVDLGATYRGYASDMARTFALSPSDGQLAIIDAVERAQRAALARVRDGASASDVDGAARTLISEAEYAEFCLHGTGHGIGLEVHEPPSLTPNSRDILREGMVVTVEPGIYVPKVGGARREDMVLVTKDGHKFITRADIADWRC